jgi:hypothetical protein
MTKYLRSLRRRLDKEMKAITPSLYLGGRLGQDRCCVPCKVCQRFARRQSGRIVARCPTLAESNQQQVLSVLMAFRLPLSFHVPALGSATSPGRKGGRLPSLLARWRVPRERCNRPVSDTHAGFLRSLLCSSLPHSRQISLPPLRCRLRSSRFPGRTSCGTIEPGR